MQELILVRHGESLHHVSGLAGGWTDLGLTERGSKQAFATAVCVRELLKGRAARVYSSDLLRAQETAEPIGRELQCSVSQTRQLRELGNGVAAGRTEAEAKALRQPRTGPALDWVPYEGGESWRQMQTRVWQFLREVDALDVPLVVVVTHGNPVIAAIHWWLGIHSDELVERIMFRADPASITRLCIDGDGCREVSFANHVAHL